MSFSNKLNSFPKHFMVRFLRIALRPFFSLLIVHVNDNFLIIFYHLIHPPLTKILKQKKTSIYSSLTFPLINQLGKSTNREVLKTKCVKKKKPTKYAVCDVTCGWSTLEFFQGSLGEREGDPWQCLPLLSLFVEENERRRKRKVVSVCFFFPLLDYTTRHPSLGAVFPPYFSLFSSLFAFLVVPPSALSNKIYSPIQFAS